jgi:hypothetical protein
LLYRARHDQSRFSAAVFERAAGSMAELSAIDLGALTDPHNVRLLEAVLDEYGFTLL